MVLREWRGRALAGNAEAYPAHFRAQVLPELRRLPGFLGATLGRRDVGGKIEFLVLTRWESMAAITAFAGSDPGRAVVEPGGVAALADFETKVAHHQVIEEA